MGRCMELNLTVAIDDIHPEKGWGMPGDECMEYLDSLHNEFGVKFTLFIPSNYHKHFPISQHKDWMVIIMKRQIEIFGVKWNSRSYKMLHR